MEHVILRIIYVLGKVWMVAVFVQGFGALWDKIYVASC